MYECPNCGGYNVLELVEDMFDDVWVECLDCGEAWLEMFPEEVEHDLPPDKGESQWDV